MRDRNHPVTIDLTADEAAALNELASEQGMSVNATMVQALRLYQLHVRRIRAGETQTWSGDADRTTPGCMGD